MKTNNIIHNCLYFRAKINFLVIFYFGAINVSWCQLTFQKGYANGDNNRLISAQQTVDFNFIAAGNAFPRNKGRMCLVKTNINGDTIWTKTYGAIEHVKCYTMQQTADNGFILGGRIVDSIIGDSKILIIKTDSNGNIIWSKTYDSVNDVEILSIKETPTGDYFIAGNGFVGKINSIGNLIWSKDLSTINVGLFIRSLDNTYDGGVILGGAIDTLLPGGLNKPFYVYLLKMSASGNIIWAKAYRSAKNIEDQGYSVSQTSDKGFIITGVTYVPVTPNVAMNHIYLVKTDSLGNLSWSKKFDSGANDNGSDVKQTSDGGYIVTGTSNGFVGNGLWTSNNFLIKTNANGNASWCKYYGSAGNANDQSASVSINNDGGYLVSGITTGTMGYPDDLYLLKTDALGDINCRGFNWPIYDSIYISAGNSINQTAIVSNLTVGNPAINTQHLICNNYGDCTVGLTTLQKDLQIKIYPNPSNDAFTISGLELNTTISLYDAIGELLYSTHSINTDTKIDISHYSNGIYFINLKNNNGEVIHKLVKQP